MTEEGLGIGARLRAAREAKGWSVQDAGSRLRLMTRQIEAIEAEDFSRLGQPVFARGFVRNYAKLLGIDPDDLLEQMTRIKVAKVEEIQSMPFTPGQEFWKSPWVLGGIAAVILAIAIPLGLYWWLTSEGDEKAAPVVEKSPPPPPAPVLEGQAVPPAAEQSAGQPAAPAADQPAPSQPTVPAQPTAPVAPQTGAPLPHTAMAAPIAPQPAPMPATGLHLQFDEVSWVQVRDGSGRIVHSGLNPAGMSVDVAGKAPFYLVVGNAEKVRVTYKGKTIDLKPFTSVNVARLTLNP